MSASIRSTIADAATAEGVNLDSYGYGPVVDAIVSALQEREYTIVETVVDATTNHYGTGYGEKAQELLTEAGLAVRPAPEPEVVEPEAPKTTDEKVDALTEALATLAGTVGKLVTLAETKLGATL